MKNTISAMWLTITLLPAAVILAGIAAVSIIFEIKISSFTRDPAAIAEIHPLLGVLSNLGVLLWCATTSICFFSALTLRNVTSKEIFWFLLSSALLSMYLLFDDLFQFHETLAPQYLGVDQKIVQVALGIFVSVYLVAFRQFILRTKYVLLLLALGLLASSVVMDAILWQWMDVIVGQWDHFFEDGAKWLGIASWCSYYVHTSFELIASRLYLPNNAIKPGARASRR